MSGVWSQDDLALLNARAAAANAEARVVKKAMHWAQFSTSAARSRDLLLACNRLAEAKARLEKASDQ